MPGIKLNCSLKGYRLFLIELIKVLKSLFGKSVRPIEPLRRLWLVLCYGGQKPHVPGSEKYPALLRQPQQYRPGLTRVMVDWL